MIKSKKHATFIVADIAKNAKSASEREMLWQVARWIKSN